MLLGVSLELIACDGRGGVLDLRPRGGVLDGEVELGARGGVREGDLEGDLELGGERGDHLAGDRGGVDGRISGCAGLLCCRTLAFSRAFPSLALLF